MRIEVYGDDEDNELVVEATIASGKTVVITHEKDGRPVSLAQMTAAVLDAIEAMEDTH